MKIKTISITWELGGNNEKEVKALLSLISGGEVSSGSMHDSPKNDGVKEAGPVADYSPSGDRAIKALQAINSCNRIKLLRPNVLDNWVLAYPHVDIAGEILKAEAWAESKDVKRTARGWQKSLNTWLSKTQDKARGGHPGAILTPSNAPVIPVKIESETAAWIEANS